MNMFTLSIAQIITIWLLGLLAGAELVCLCYLHGKEKKTMPVKSAIVNHITYDAGDGPVNAIVKMRVDEHEGQARLIVTLFDADSGETITPASAMKMRDDVVITLVEGGIG